MGVGTALFFERPGLAWSVQRLADIAGMSRSAFASRFERAFGRPPMTMLTAVRLRKAGQLLATTALQVSEVARAVGFSSRSNFSQAFSKLHGMDPTAFRQQSRPRHKLNASRSRE
jgi:AraC-like DNA-binding protein